MNLAMTGASGLKGKVYTTLLVLAHHADDDTGQCWPSRSAIAFRARQSTRTTSWAIGELEKAGWISVDLQAGRRGCNRYTIDLARLRAEAVHQPAKRTPRKVSPRSPQPVQKSVEKLRNSCARTVKKQVKKARGRATSCTRTIKEELGIREVQGKTEAVTAGSVFPASPSTPPSRLLVKLPLAIRNLNRAIERGPRSRGPDPAWLTP
jgi:hypothetical protein